MENKFSFTRRSLLLMALLVILLSALVGGSFGFLAGLASPRIARSLVHDLPWLTSLVPPEAPPAVSSTKQTYQLQENSATIEAVKKVSPAVVSIVVTKDLSKIYEDGGFSPFNDFFDFGFPFNFRFQQPSPPQGKQEVGGGTGFVVDSKQGLIVTNKHVVADEEAEYSVLTNDGERYDAKVLARDPLNDIAVIKIEADNLSQVELGDSDSLEIGQTVVAIGNALGEYRNTVTRGVISGINREITAGGSQGSEHLEGIIQTDAAINPGNSGGPLINLVGQVIGINTAIDREGQSIGFAIPVKAVRQVVESVSKYGKIVRPYLGVRYIMIDKKIAKENNLSVEKGALIVRGDKRTELAVMPGSPADKADLEENDIILKVNGQEIDESHSLSKLIQQYSSGDEVELLLLHKGKEKTVKVTLEEYKG